MVELMRLALRSGGYVLVEVGAEEPGVVRASRTGDVIQSTAKSLEMSLEPIRDAAESALRTFRRAAPAEITIEFGVRLTAEAGAVIAKTGAEGHLQVALVWRNESTAEPAEHNATRQE